VREREIKTEIEGVCVREYELCVSASIRVSVHSTIVDSAVQCSTTQYSTVHQSH
jgi:hypothetical protein